MPKQRLDVLMVERGMVESRTLAQRLIMAGKVRVRGQVEWKPATKIEPDEEVQIEQEPRYVSRGGEKLEAALHAFQIGNLLEKVCVDVGASTGGFTDCLLQHGAGKVYAIDVGYGILHWRIRQDERVVVMERTNARYVTHLPEAIDLVSIDASFISLKVLLPVVKNWMRDPASQIIALIKPQFEAGRQEAARGEGVIRDPEIHSRILKEVLDFALNCGFFVRGLIRSPLQGPKGNIEFLVWLDQKGPNLDGLDELVEAVLASPLPEDGGETENTESRLAGIT